MFVELHAIKEHNVVVIAMLLNRIVVLVVFFLIPWRVVVTAGVKQVLTIVD